jgi:hypothetical protein
MKLLSIINDLIIINENKQLADKVYFNTGLLDERDKNFIYGITHGDFTTKLICDMYVSAKDHEWLISKFRGNLKSIHQSLVEYNPNVVPIKDFNINGNNTDGNLYWSLLQRIEIILELRKLPSIAIRNMKAEIRQPRDHKELSDYHHLLTYFAAQYSMLGNHNPEQKKRIEQKMFKSGVTIDKLIRFADEKENLLQGSDINKEHIEKIIHESYGELKKIYEKNNIMVVGVYSADAIKEIGCNSLWCFTYGEYNEMVWNNYSKYGMVYIIINFDISPDYEDFMILLIEPLKSRVFYEKVRDKGRGEHSPLFYMTNDNVDDPYWVLDRLFKPSEIKKIFTFDN